MGAGGDFVHPRPVEASGRQMLIDPGDADDPTNLTFSLRSATGDRKPQCKPRDSRLYPGDLLTQMRQRRATHCISFCFLVRRRRHVASFVRVLF
jgi:hypothetical protein